jgi:hypothetical protein
VNEWQLQLRLESLWARDGVPAGSDSLLLVGREVMTDWRRNDARRAWNKPSVDFVTLDRQGRLVMIEVKNRINTRRQALDASLQITAMALSLAASVTWHVLDGAYGELLADREQGSVNSAWLAQVAGQPANDGHVFTPVRRILAAPTLGTADLFTGELGDVTPTQLLRWRMESGTTVSWLGSGSSLAKRFSSRPLRSSILTRPLSRFRQIARPWSIQAQRVRLTTDEATSTHSLRRRTPFFYLPERTDRPLNVSPGARARRREVASRRDVASRLCGGRAMASERAAGASPAAYTCGARASHFADRRGTSLQD